MRFKVFSQPDSMDCGPTCLKMVAFHYGQNYSLQLLRDKCEIGKEGVNLLGISNAAQFIGFQTHTAKLSIDSLVKQVQLPIILHWKQNHFVVLYKIKKRKFFYVADPAAGAFTYTVNDFKKAWLSDCSGAGITGIALMLYPNASFFNLNKEEVLKPSNIFNYLLPYRRLLFQLLLGLGLGSLLQLVLPFLTQSIVDTGINTSNLHFVYIILFAQLSLFAGRLAIDFVRGWILLHISTRINLSILTSFLGKLMRLPISFFDSKHVGDIMQRMNDHTRIESFLTGSSLNVLFSLVNLLIFSVVLALFNNGIFIIFILSSLLYAGWILIFLKKKRVLDHQRFAISANEQAATIQLVQGMQEIKLHGAEKLFQTKWQSIQLRLFHLSMRNLSITQWQQLGAFVINDGKNILITFLAARAVIDGQLTLGAMLAIQYIIGQLNSPVEQLISLAQSWQNAKISMDRLNEVHRLEDEEPVTGNFLQELPVPFTRMIAGGRGFSNIKDTTSAIVFNNVTFTYPGAGNTPVLSNICISIPKGKTTAIVGMSGSGKTTLLKLLLKFHSPQSGEIHVDDFSLNRISHRLWRKQCGVVLQDSFIFSDSIANNIAVTDEPINVDKLIEACTIANIYSFIESLPLGFNTRIGSDGTGLSMGQRQRLLIARAVYRDPSIILFDEATNSLDANNEKTIVENLASFASGRTLIVVAHRLSTVKNADQIIVLRNGRVVEQGTHQELFGLKEEYFTLIKNQLDLSA